MTDERPRPSAPRARAASLRTPRVPLALAGILSAALLFQGCDNPACLFGSACGTAQPPSGALGTTAEPAVDGELLLAGPPTVVRSAPSGGNRHADTPAVIEFSESMAPDTVLDAFLIVNDASGVPVMSSSALLGDGRLLLLLPDSALPAATYAIEPAQNAAPTDLGGAELDLDALSLPTFTVGSSNPTAPAVVAVFPPNGATNQSSTTEVVCVFDRSIAPPLDLATGWDVQVRPVGGVDAPPMFDPDPAPLEVLSFLGVPITDDRVWSWRSVSGDEPQRLTTSGGRVTVTISPVAAPFVDSAAVMQEVPQTVSAFTLSTAPRPRTGLLNPGIEPQDAIGIANLDGLDMALDLALQVDFEADDPAQPGDVLTVFVFGADPEDASNTIAFERSITLAGAGPIMTDAFTRAELDLTITTAPLVPRLADGDVRFAIRIERSGQEGYVRLLDVDLVAPGAQDPILDTDPPALLRFDVQTDPTDPIASDLADLVVAGFADVGANDFVRGARVESMTGAGTTNVVTPGVVPEVLGSAPALVPDGMGGMVLSSAFLASPAPVGALEPGSGPLDVVVTVFDRALNASPPSRAVSWRQRGVVGTTLLDSTDPTPLVVEVFDSGTLQPLAGARVYAHAEVDDGLGNLSYVQLGAGALLTDADGLADTVPHHDATQERTLVTVELPGYDVFTFHGVPTTHLSVPLTPAQQVLASESSSVLVAPGVSLATLVRRVGDTRRVDTAFPTVATLATPGTTEFDFTVPSLRPFRLGAESFLAGILDAQLANVSKDRLLKAFELRIPVDGPASAVVVSAGAMTVDRLLDDADGPPEDVPKAVTDVQLTAETLVGMDPESLRNDASYGRQPLVEVEATLPGVDRPLPVGLGTAYDVVANPRRWNLRAAYAGAADPADGSLADVIDGDLHLRAELREEIAMAPGAVSGMRPDIADLAALDPLRVPDVPAITSIPTDGSGTLVSQGFDLTFTDTIDAATGLAVDGRGLHRVTLTEVPMGGVPGRRWVLYTLDDAGAAEVTVHFPDLSPDPSPLASGAAATTSAQVSTFAWEAFPTFDPMVAEARTFLWTDLGREVEAYAHAASVLFTLL